MLEHPETGVRRKEGPHDGGDNQVWLRIYGNVGAMTGRLYHHAYDGLLPATIAICGEH
jgi:hypothetical protein